MNRYGIKNNHVTRYHKDGEDVTLEVTSDLFSVLEKYTNGIDYIIGFYSGGPLPYVALKHTLIIAKNLDDMEGLKNKCFNVSDDYYIVHDYGKQLFSTYVRKIYNILEFMPSIVTINSDMENDLDVVFD